MSYSFFIINHSTGKPGSLDTFLNWLEEKNNPYFLMTHPLDNYSQISTSFKAPNNQKISIKRKNRGFINFLIDFYYSTKYLRKTNFDIFISTNNFDTLPAIFCKMFLRKKIPRIIYYPSDYSEHRFDNKLLDLIYHFTETIAVKKSDYTISNTKRSEEKRVVSHGLLSKKSIIIGNPISMKLDAKPHKSLSKNNFIYIGDVSYEHGLSEIIKIIHPLIKKLTIIGDGNDLINAKRVISEYSIEAEIFGKQSHEIVMKKLHSFNGIGLAPYTDKVKWTYYSCPLKTGEYIASGLPVLMSDIPESSKDIKREGLGIVYNQANLSEIEENINRFSYLNFLKRFQKYYLKNTPEELYGKIPLELDK
jgi:glycosyltransferase involved in cell wall biosynthesis